MIGIHARATRAPAPDEGALESDRAQSIQRALAGLTPREAKILRMRFGIDDANDRTLEEIGRAFGVTRERVRQIEAQALAKLRRPRVANSLRAQLDG